MLDIVGCTSAQMISTSVLATRASGSGARVDEIGMTEDVDVWARGREGQPPIVALGPCSSPRRSQVERSLPPRPPPRTRKRSILKIGDFVRKIGAHQITASDLNTFTNTFLINMRMKFVTTTT